MKKHISCNWKKNSQLQRDLQLEKIQLQLDLQLEEKTSVASRLATGKKSQLQLELQPEKKSQLQPDLQLEEKISVAKISDAIRVATHKKLICNPTCKLKTNLNCNTTCN